MAIKKTFQVGSESVRSRSKIVKNVRAENIKKTIQDLVDTMRHENLVGMAAPQIGKNERIFVSEIRKTAIRRNLQKDKLRIFINPRIIEKSKSQTVGYEGCGSVGLANLFGPVKRFQRITVVAIDSTGKHFKLNVAGLLARIVQHEIDHLDGVVFLDKVKNTRRLLGRDEYIRLHRRN